MDADSLEKKYVNVVGRSHDSVALTQVARELTMAGFGDRIVVTKGIRAGELVVTQGQDGLRKGQDVSIVGDQS